MSRDPVCGMEVGGDEFSFEHGGRKYLFCSNGCLEKFRSSPARFSGKRPYDLVIIGGGPAGLTAAVYASVLKIDTFLVTADIGGQAMDSSRIKNYMGFDFIRGEDLVERFKAQFLHEHYLDHGIDEVTLLERDGDGGFRIAAASGRELSARSVIVASGMRRRRLGVPGEERLQRRGVSYSALQDISLFKGMDTVVVGGGNSGVQTAADLAGLGCSITLVSKGRLTADRADIAALEEHEAVRILENHDVVEILGEERVEGVVLRSLDTMETETVGCGGVFIQIGLVPNTGFCRGLLETNERGEIVIGSDCSTSVEGVFACGDVTNAFGKRIVIASGEGAKAALSAGKYLLRESVAVEEENTGARAGPGK